MCTSAVATGCQCNIGNLPARGPINWSHSSAKKPTQQGARPIHGDREHFERYVALALAAYQAYQCMRRVFEAS